MNHLSAVWKTAVLGLLAASPSQMRADYLDWSYTTSANVPAITALGGTSKGGATVSLTPFSTPQLGAATIPLLIASTSTAYNEPIKFQGVLGSTPAYFLTMTLTDNATHQYGTITFSGSLWGSLTKTSSNVVARFDPINSDGMTSLGSVDDGYAITVIIPPVTLAPPNSPPQEIMATVSVVKVHSSPATPEPSALLLGSLGISGLGVGCWRQRWRLTRSLWTA